MGENRIQQIASKPGPLVDFNGVMRIGINNWRLIFVISFFCALAAGLISFLVPNRYTATASILPTTNGGSHGSLLSMAENIPGLDLSSINPSEKSPSILYPEILSSRMIAQEVLEHPYIYKNKGRWQTQNLYQYLDINNPDKAIKALARIVGLTTDRKTGVLKIDVTTTNPQLSALVANYYLECLDNFNQNQRKTSAGQNRQFIEKRLLEAKSQLSDAEESLKNLRRRNMNYYNATDPELAMLNNQLQREVEVKSQVYLTLCQQFELASIQEKKEIPVIQILDKAQPPSVKSGPNRAKTAIIGFLLGAIAAFSLLIVDNRNPKFKQYFGKGFSVRRLYLIRKGSENTVSACENVEQY